MKKIVINLAVSPAARTRLEELARKLEIPLGVALERAIMAYVVRPEPASRAGDLAELRARIAALESAVAALQAVTAAPVAAPLPEYQAAPEAAEIAAPVAVDATPSDAASPAMEPAVPSPSTTGRRKHHDPERDAAIAEVFRGGVRGSPAIGAELQRRGIVNSKGRAIDAGTILDSIRRQDLK